MNWGKHFPSALGRRQSPIDFHPSHVYYDENLKSVELHFDYHPEDITMLKNTGSSFRLITREGSVPSEKLSNVL